MLSFSSTYMTSLVPDLVVWSLESMVTTPIDQQGEYKAICLWKVKGRDLQKDVNDFSAVYNCRKEGR